MAQAGFKQVDPCKAYCVGVFKMIGYMFALRHRTENQQRANLEQCKDYSK